jgi:ectoine hydroxylase-related dioxygenase (phytanoyl-CoA dioxygenase family)
MAVDVLDPSQRAAWDRDGYLAIPGFFTSAQVDQLNRLTETMYRRRPRWLVVDHTVTGRRALLADLPRRERMGRQLKLNDLYLECPQVRAVGLDPRVRAILGALLDEPAVLCNSLNFERGSQQGEHIDSLFMTPRTPNKLAAIWVALEDAHPEAGQLFYYPGSQAIPLYTFSDGSHHANAPEMPAWVSYIGQEMTARGLQRRTFPAKKGDLFIWSANLVHGGSPIGDLARTRKSLVCHYYAHSDCVALGFDCVPAGGDGFWLRRAHPSVPTVTVPRRSARAVAGRALRLARLGPAVNRLRR